MRAWRCAVMPANCELPPPFRYFATSDSAEVNCVGAARGIAGGVVPCTGLGALSVTPMLGQVLLLWRHGAREHVRARAIEPM
jgi:hypothetical protein